MVEQWTHKPLVVGSNPTLATKYPEPAKWQVLLLSEISSFPPRIVSVPWAWELYHCIAMAVRARNLTARGKDKYSATLWRPSSRASSMR